MDRERVGTLPAFVALEALPVLEGAKPAASVQLDDTYFDGVASALSQIDGVDAVSARIEGLRRTREVFDEISVEIGSVDVPSLMEASRRLRDVFATMPEVGTLCAAWPDEAFVVPEWYRRDDATLNYGMRVYFLPPGGGPDPSEIVRRNVEGAVRRDRRDFERFHGRLHGYPDCCVERFLDRDDGGPSPERAAVDPFDAHVREDLVGSGPSVSVREIVPDLFDHDRPYSFFAREFFPEPGCDEADAAGEAVYEALVDELPEGLVRDYFRLNLAFGYAVAEALERPDGSRPSVGDLGIEHVYVALPLQLARGLSRYG